VKILLISVAVIVGVLVVVGGVVAWRVRRAADNPSAVTAVRLETPVRGDLVEVVSAPGEIRPLKKVVISARVSARITALPFKEGQRVTQGAPDANPPVPPSVLVRLDSKELEATLRSAESRRSAQEAQIAVEKSRLASQEASDRGIRTRLEDAQRELDRLSQLLRSKVVSQSEVDSAQCKVDELKAEIAAAESSLEAATLNLGVLRYNLSSADAEVAKVRDNLSYTTITAPMDGIVTKVNAEEGELAVTGTMNNPGTVILEVADLSQMLLVAQIDESDVGAVQTGQKATVRIQAYPDRTFEGVVQNVALTHILSQTRSKVFEAEITLNTDGQEVRSGLTADVDIETRRHQDVLKVPTQAVLARRAEDLPVDVRKGNPNVDMSKTDATVVYRCINNKVVVTPVKIGASDATHTVILSGVGEGDRIVVGPYKVLEKLTHDQPLRDEAAGGDKKGATLPASAPAGGSMTAPASAPGGA
jgi:HlyD family secretion protein